MLSLKLCKFLLVIIFLLSGSTVFGQETYLDSFNTTSYSNNNGTQSFSANWVETNESTSPSGGKIRIRSSELEFKNLDGRTIARTLDLLGASAVTLTFDYDATSRGNESLVAQLWNIGTSS